MKPVLRPLPSPLYDSEVGHYNVAKESLPCATCGKPTPNRVQFDEDVWCAKPGGGSIRLTLKGGTPVCCKVCEDKSFKEVE
jgi:hypothetical protein